MWAIQDYIDIKCSSDLLIYTEGPEKDESPPTRRLSFLLLLCGFLLDHPEGVL